MTILFKSLITTLENFVFNFLPKLNMFNLAFYLLLLVLPFNLGYHFVYKSSYVNGLLIDYLIPAVYVQDILIVLLIIFWLLTKRSFSFVHLKDALTVRILFLFLLSLFFSTLVSINYPISIFTFLRFMLYALVSVLVAASLDVRKNWILILKLLLISTFFVEILALIQWFKQASVFNNYVFFGEQPYTFSTYGISRESFFGKTVIPPYGTFRHPNILAGYLSILLIWFYAFLKKLPTFRWFCFSLAVMVLGVVIIILTMSLTALLALVLGLVQLVVLRIRSKQFRFALFFLPLLIVSLISLNLVRFSAYFPDNPSFYRRINLYEVARDNVGDYFLFGSGIGASTEISANYFTYLDEIKYPQPVHNIFILMFLEGGVFALFFYLLLYTLLLIPLYKRNLVFSVSFFQFMVLGAFDHYVLTIHQTNLLFWLTLSFYFAYNYLVPKGHSK